MAIGALGVPGGWFDSAPGTPPGGVPPCWFDSLDCWLRIAALPGSWLGLYFSSVCSITEKSMSAATWARTLLAPTIGCRMASMRRM